MTGDILVLSEHKDAELDNITYELLAKGRSLADAWGTRLAVLLVGSGLEPLVNTLRNSGADKILTAEHVDLKDYNAEAYASVIAKSARDYAPSLFLMGYTYLGMEVGPSVAVRLGGTMVTNCTELEVEDEGISVVRSMFAGTLQARIKLVGPVPYIVSFEKGVLSREVLSLKEATVEPVPVDLDTQGLRSKILELIIPHPGAVDITKARVLVSVGRGIGNRDKIQIIRDLADALGGTVACSRPIADMGWLPSEHQVGISAKTVTPDIYIACGISGATQHVTAMRDSGMIIAINKDPNAPIFRVADYGIVGDLFEILPPLIQEAKKEH
jgi:electron transfer flavoprotein alpha subunit